eukprot:985006-Prorocentrum_lima.AAC.1
MGGVRKKVQAAGYSAGVSRLCAYRHDTESSSGVVHGDACICEGEEAVLITLETELRKSIIT